MRTAALLAAGLAVTRCAEPPTPAAVAPGQPRVLAVPAQTPPPAVTLDEAGKPVLFNDPPAPPGTPLCGSAAQQADAIGFALQGARVAATGICASFTCYDPLTATYLGADGYRHVCR